MLSLVIVLIGLEWTMYYFYHFGVLAVANGGAFEEDAELHA